MMDPINSESFYSQIADRIREMIRQGHLLKGQKVKESDLCEKLGVSRTPVREALRTLSSEGLINLIPQKGAFVSEPPIEKIKEMLDIMALLEGEAGRLATKRLTTIELSKLEAMHDELETHFANQNTEKYLQVNFRYHRLIQDLAGNETLSNIIESLRDKVLLFRSKQLSLEGRFERSIIEHRALLLAFQRKKSNEVEKIMKVHLLNQSTAMVELFRSLEKTTPGEDK
jgi:DNA-binding GntR family transcriptional regulator